MSVPAEQLNAKPSRTRRPAGVPDGWVRLSDAAEISGRHPRTLRDQIKTLPETARCKAGGSVWFDPRYLPSALLPAPGLPPLPEENPELPFNRPEAIRRDLLVRDVVRAARAYIDQRLRSGLKSEGAALAEFTTLHGDGRFFIRWTNPRTLAGWMKTEAAGGHFFERRGRRQGHKVGKKAGAFYFLLYERPGMTHQVAWEYTVDEAAKHAGDPAWFWPSSETVRCWQHRNIPRMVLDYHKKGPDAWRANYELKLDRDPRSEPANALWELDASKFNFWCRHHGKRVRGTYAILTDVGSRMILGHAVGLSESTEVLMHALARAVMKYGAPYRIRVDRGRANLGSGIVDIRKRREAAAWQHVLGVLRIISADPEVMLGRSGWKKGSVESAVNTVSTRFDTRPEFTKAYLGRRPGQRIRGVDAWCDEHLNELFTLAEVDQKLGEFIVTNNARPRKDFNKHTPLEVFAETCIPKRALYSGAEEYLRRRPIRVKVTKNGIRFRIGGVPLQFGQDHQRLWDKMGERMVALVDSQDLSQVLVCDADLRNPFWVRRDMLKGVTAETLRELGKRNSRFRRIRRELSDAWRAEFTSAEVQAATLQRDKDRAEAARCLEARTLADRPAVTLVPNVDTRIPHKQESNAAAKTGTHDIPADNGFDRLVEAGARWEAEDAARRRSQQAGHSAVDWITLGKRTEQEEESRRAAQAVDRFDYMQLPDAEGDGDEDPAPGLMLEDLVVDTDTEGIEQ